VEVARPSSAGLLTSKSIRDTVASSSAVDKPALTSQPRGLSVDASSMAADKPEVLSRVETASDIVVEVENDNDSRAPEVVHRRRRKKAKKKRSVTGDGQEQQQQPFSS